MLTAVGCDPNSTATVVPNTELPEAVVQNTLTFKWQGEAVSKLTVAQIQTTIPLKQFSAFDPYHQKPKTWKAFELKPVLELAYGTRFTELAGKDLILRASDGYQVPISAADLLRPGAYIAVLDVEKPSWEPIGNQKANPGPFYMVWRGADQQDFEAFPRPWQLAEFEVATFEDLYPKTLPTLAKPGDDVWLGFQTFKAQCSRCHAINQQGGLIGPELNVPQNITEYRPEDQIRAYIKNPMTFRYSKMPAFPGLSEQDLDRLIAYLRAMSALKQDPAANAAQP